MCSLTSRTPTSLLSRLFCVWKERRSSKKSPASIGSIVSVRFANLTGSVQRCNFSSNSSTTSYFGMLKFQSTASMPLILRRQFRVLHKRTGTTVGCLLHLGIKICQCALHMSKKTQNLCVFLQKFMSKILEIYVKKSQNYVKMLTK